MITVDEVIYLLTSGLVSEMYVPHSYLSIEIVHYLLQQHNWMVQISEMEGWVRVRKRIIYQD